MNPPGRKSFLHQLPSWVDPEACDFFITICCQQRGINPLCDPPARAQSLLSAARVYHEQRKWFPSLFLLMPDHLHMLVAFGREYDLNAVIGSWKRYAATQYGIAWRRGFFEHRLRSEESMDEKAAYILQNPVRAGLVRDVRDWPFVLMLD